MKPGSSHPLPFTILILLLGSLIVLISCGKEKEDFTTLTIALPSFDTVQLQAVFDVELIQGDSCTLQISGDRSIIQDITWSVEDRTLFIRNSNTELWTRPKSVPPKLVITGNTFARVNTEETCSIISRNTITSQKFGITLGGKLNFVELAFDGELFYFWNAAPSGGQVKLSGHSRFIHLYNSNLMKVDAGALLSEYAIVVNSSKSDTWVNVNTQLNYRITGTGNIYLLGDPVEIFNEGVTSSGRLIR